MVELPLREGDLLSVLERCSVGEAEKRRVAVALTCCVRVTVGDTDTVLDHSGVAEVDEE